MFSWTQTEPELLKSNLKHFNSNGVVNYVVLTAQY